MRSLPFVLLVLSSAAADAATVEVLATRATTIHVEGTTSFNTGSGPTQRVSVLAPSVLGLPDGTFLGTPEFSLDLTFAELFVDYRFERDVNISGNLAPNVRVTPAVLDIGPVPDRPMAIVNGRFVRDVTPASATGAACEGPFSYCYPISTNDLGPADFQSFVDTLFVEYGVTRNLPGVGSIRDFSGLSGSDIVFGALGYDGVFSNNRPVAGDLLFDPRFRFEYELTYTQTYLFIQPDAAVVPLPAGFWLLTAGLTMLFGATRASRALTA